MQPIEQRKRLNSDEALNLQLQRTWKSLRPLDWHDAVYNPGRGTFFAVLVDRTVEYLEARAREIEVKTGRSVVFVEVGAARGGFSAFSERDAGNRVLGIDINEDFVRFALENVRGEARGRLDFKHGDCQRLLEIVDELMDGLKEPHAVLTFSVNNTHRVLPEDVERSINVQIEKLYKSITEYSSWGCGTRRISARRCSTFIFRIRIFAVNSTTATPSSIGKILA